MSKKRPIKQKKQQKRPPAPPPPSEPLFMGPDAPPKPKRFALILTGIVVLGFVVIWGEFYSPKVTNPWQDSLVWIDSAKTETDTALKASFLQKAEDILSEQVNEHPYHARIWMMKGYLHLQTQEYDSVISCQKKALELGAGGVVNRIDVDAVNMMGAALLNKVNKLNMDTTAIFALLDSAEVDGFKNFKILWLRGAINNQAGQHAVAVRYLRQAYQLNVRDFDILYHFAVALARTGQTEKAKTRLQQALNVQPNNAAAKNLMAQLNARTQ